MFGRQVPLTGKLLGTRLIKYGVVSTQTLCEDLTTWKTLYLSGRMHKPVRSLIVADYGNQDCFGHETLIFVVVVVDLGQYSCYE